MVEKDSRVIGQAVRVCYRISLRDWRGASEIGKTDHLKTDRS